LASAVNIHIVPPSIEAATSPAGGSVGLDGLRIAVSD